MRFNKNIKRILCAILCLCMTLGTLMALTSCNSGEETPAETEDPNANKVSVVRAIKTIEIGSKIERADFEEVMIDKDVAPEGAYSTIKEVVNKFLKVNVYSGDVLVPDKVSKTANIFGDEEAGTIHEDYVVVTQYLSGGDATEGIQKAIDENPNKTIYFPDGNYIISKPITTSADPDKCVSLRLSNYAVITAAAEWKGEEGDSLIMLGATDSEKDGNYYMVGGVVACNSEAGAISVCGGYALINNFSIKLATIGITIKEGARADVDSGVIIGSSAAKLSDGGAIGVLMEGENSTLTNMRICSIHTGVKLTGSNNRLRNIHPLYVTNNDNWDSTGFWDEGETNYYDVCYSDQFAVGFRMSANTKSVYNGCFAYWYAGNSGRHYGFLAEGAFNSIIRDTQVNLAYPRQKTDGNDSPVWETDANGDYKLDANGQKIPVMTTDIDSTFLSVTLNGGKGVVLFPRMSNTSKDDHIENWKPYLETDILS